MNFDPNGTGSDKLGVFSLPYGESEAELVFIPVPWEVTTSFGDGCSLGPDVIFNASKQLDLCDALYGQFYQRGIYQQATDIDWLNKNQDLKKQALLLKKQLESGEPLSESQLSIQEQINRASEQINDWVYEQSRRLLDMGKFCAVIGGDHSSPFGIIRALSEKYSDLSILHIDAHMDLRPAYQGYEHSHASIMYNVLHKTSVQSIVQMGIRDYCPQEHELSQKDPRVHTFYDSQVSLSLGRGESWESIVLRAINKLTDHVYISFDIDGLAPDLCPNTGTPVPGGLNFGQMEALLYQLSSSNKKIVGFDLCEVSAGSKDPSRDSWDANVGARVLFKLAGATLHNN
jgi:agmatinase